MLCNSRRTRAFVLALSAGLGLCWACKRKDAAPAPTATSSAAPAPPPAPRCQEAYPGKSFSLGERGSARKESDAEDEDDGTDQPALPFAVEIGRAVAFGKGFAVSALSTRGGKVTAVVALLDAEVGAGRLAELGRLHADPDPPELATLDDDLVALVHDSDAGGQVLRLVGVRPGPDKIDVVLGAEVNESRDESRVADLELGPERGVAIWDEYSRADKHGVIMTASFSRKDLSALTKRRIVSTPTEDAESPRIVRRPGGFWAFWIARAVPPKRDPTAPAPPPAPSASAGNEPDPAVVELGERYLVAVPLDGNGVATSAPKAVTPKSAHVLVYDVAVGAEGSALFSWRDGDAAPGTGGRSVHVARVKSDGSVERHALDDEGAGVGVPTLLVAAPPAGAPHGWLALDSVSDATRLAALSPAGAILDTLGAEPAVRSAELLSFARGQLLVARPKGMAIELGLLRCAPGPAPAAKAP
jgi:hypothetical protein